MIYADNAATTALHSGVLQAMLPYLTEVPGNPGSLHAAGYRVAQAITKARERVANHLACRPREVFFTSGGSEANNQALLSAVAWGRPRNRLHLVSTTFEHPSVLRTLAFLESTGVRVTLVDPNPQGIVSPREIENVLQADTCAVSVMTVNNEVGTIQPIKDIASLCKDRGVLFHTDAVQAVGHIPVAVAPDGIDLLSLSAHKFHGPQGSGALICRADLQPASLIHGGGQERGCRAGTENVPGIVGLAAALEEACASLQEDADHVSGLADRLRVGLGMIPDAHIIGDPCHRVPGIVSVCFEGVERESLLALLDRDGICASAGSACSAGALERSHVLRSMGVSDDCARGVLRLSLCRDNTATEVEAIVHAVNRIVAKLRSGGTGDPL